MFLKRIRIDMALRSSMKLWMNADIGDRIKVSLRNLNSLQEDTLYAGMCFWQELFFGSGRVIFSGLAA
jgi:hypothetical protein